MFRRTKLAAQDMGQRWKYFIKHQIIFHFVRKIAYLIYYGIFIYLIVGCCCDKEVVVKYKLSFVGSTLLVVVLIGTIFKIISFIGSMKRGYTKIALGGAIYSGLMYGCYGLAYSVSKMNLDIAKTFLLIFWMLIVRTILLLADEFIYTGFKLADEEDNKEEGK